MKVIGSADEFWRLRLTRVDVTTDVDFEWHDDILYREPEVSSTPETAEWNIEAIRLDDFEILIRVATFGDRECAQTAFAQMSEDLAQMTKSQFEEKYLTPEG